VSASARAAEQSSAPAAGKAQAERPWQPPAVQAVYVETPPVIDGKLDDPCWGQASRLEGFFVSNIDMAVPEETIGLICVDDKAIYVAAICKDRTPEDIIATETRRNGDIWQDDLVELGLDPWHKHSDIYWFQVTARGTQNEEIPGGSATKIEWRGDWRAAATRTPDGWQAEMEIPFSILPYPPGQSTFGFVVSRKFAQERVWITYPIMEGRAYNRQQVADLVGLHPPISAPRPIFMPYVVPDLGDSVGGHFDMGLDVQYKMRHGLTALTTINPDFKQIEDVVEPISFSYTERQLPDLRPFFVTGQDPYLMDSYIFYTRRIQDFDTGFKLFGKLGNDMIGVLDAVKLGEENTFASAWTHQMDPEFMTKLGIISHRRAGEPDNFVYGLFAHNRWPHPMGGDNMWLWCYQSQLQGKRSDGYYQFGGEHWRGAGELAWQWWFQTIGPSFHPDLAYIIGQNSIGGSINLNEWDKFETGRLEYKRWNLGTSYMPFRDGSGMYDSHISYDRHWAFRSGKSFSIGINRAQQYDQDSSDLHGGFGWNNRDIHRRGGLYLVRGVRAGGDYRYLSLNQGFRPRRRLSFQVGAEYMHLLPPSIQAGHQYQTVLTTSYDLTPERCVSARLIARDAGVSGYAAYRQVVRRGMDAYVLVGDPDPALTGFTRRVAVKLIWVF